MLFKKLSVDGFRFLNSPFITETEQYALLPFFCLFVCCCFYVLSECDPFQVRTSYVLHFRSSSIIQYAAAVKASKHQQAKTGELFANALDSFSPASGISTVDSGFLLEPVRTLHVSSGAIAIRSVSTAMTLAVGSGSSLL
jgi:hypothetical protein